MRSFAKAVSVCLFLAGGQHATAGSLSPEQKSEFGEIIRGYLLDHPEILREMSAKLEANERAVEEAGRTKSLTENAAAIFKSGRDPVVGNANGDVTLVEFMDYNCSWCKKSMTEVSALVEKDKNLRVVFKEFPIFGAGSEYAARAAIAASRQGKYWDLHRALFSNNGPITEEVTDQIAEAQGIDIAKMKSDMADPEIDSTVKANQALGASLAINGTPAFIVDDTVVPGYMPADGLAAAIDDVRASGGCKLC